MVLNASDNVKYYLQNATLMSVLGQPIYETLDHLQKEVRANSKAVPCGLGSGKQGHLGLVTSATTRACTNPAAAVILLSSHPAVLVHIQYSAQYQIAESVRQYHEDIR